MDKVNIVSVAENLDVTEPGDSALQPEEIVVQHKHVHSLQSIAISAPHPKLDDTTDTWEEDLKRNVRESTEDLKNVRMWEEDLKRNVRESVESKMSLGTAFPPYVSRNSIGNSSRTPADSGNPFQTGPDGRKRVVVVGSGDFGLALTGRLVQADYSVVVASRNPNRTRERVTMCGGNVATLGEGLRKEESGVVVVAIPPQHHSSLPINLLAGKILIDVSNRKPDKNDPNRHSQAEALQTLVPGAKVVKALNVLSAYALSHGSRGTKEVPVCGNDEAARRVVCGMVRDLGFDPVDQGRLSKAREVESIPFRFFPSWRFAFTVSLVVWSLAFLITVYECLNWFRHQAKWLDAPTIKYFIDLDRVNLSLMLFFLITICEWDVCDNLLNLSQGNNTMDWSGFKSVASSNLSVSCGCTALTLLSLCYLPGVLAGYLQLYRGTKYSEFPHWLDRWLRSRKQLGLLMLLNAIIHVRVLSFVLAGILGVASLPSVSATMTWREFNFIQSRLGWFSLVLALAHVIFHGWAQLINFNLPCYLPSIGQLVVLVPLVTVILKIPLLLPCIDRPLTNIRQGYERVSVKPVV
ncbi:hypothetical protein Pmani_008465 [Petrolisthes manimaculis]|uniref:Pyrroline-5-carboxylate reductase catalytic N-terminal domain-containing protein n=1 Tax=Petrolisthes manimaculis TaxID=1843537 RepID=A0AAE1Q6X4_9EUCA|nr:hypothetical protein Pmani_008465 [Petrolisthes manimaculis]